MKDSIDLAQAWFRKADSDFENAQLCFASGKSLDTACFHCQQAAEKWLKSYLIAAQISFPFVHDLTKLLDLCSRKEPEFQSLQGLALQLNPYAVLMRYDEQFGQKVVAEALQAAQAFRVIVIKYWPVRDRMPNQ